jgi:hypothetical protein
MTVYQSQRAISASSNYDDESHGQGSSFSTDLGHLQTDSCSHQFIPRLSAVIRLSILRRHCGTQISRLNCDLLDVTQLYEQFSEPLGLWECKLAILPCANHYDAALVTNIWQNVINAEVKKLQVNDRLKCQ